MLERRRDELNIDGLFQRLAYIISEGKSKEIIINGIWRIEKPRRKRDVIKGDRDQFETKEIQDEQEKKSIIRW